MPTDESDDRLKRRSVLRAVAVTSASASLAGCTFHLGRDGIEVGLDSDDDSPEERTEVDTPADTSDDESADDSDPQEREGDPGDTDDDDGERGEDADDGEDVDEEDEDEADSPPSFEEDCIGFDSDNLRVVRVRVQDSDGSWKYVVRLQDDTRRLVQFESMSDAQLAKDIIEFYGFDQQCFVGRPDSAMTYWLVGGRPASVSRTSFDEDCNPIDLTNLTVSQTTGGDWRLSDGSGIIATNPDEEAIRTAKATIEHYGFSRRCFVARPGPPMTYWLTE